jgi:menaquinone-dependent protoporphyrinogen IX oxidase
MQKTLIIYESEYGTTEQVAKYLSLVLGPAKYCKTADFNDDYKDFDFIVIGSPIYSGNALPKINEFIIANLNWLKKKNVALFCTCLSFKDGNENLIAMEKLLGKAVSKRALGGILKLDTLKKSDSQSLKEFSKKMGFKLGDMDNFKLDEVVEYALELKLIKEDLIPKMSFKELQNIVEELLTNHNTCTLSTSYKERVRSTPIEYNYFNGYIYLLSEGGEKFANILQNEHVSIAIYEDYTNMNNLLGMQISGTASMIENEDDYKNIITMKGLNLNFIDRMPVNMNIIKIDIQKIEVLYSKFKKMGYEPKQILQLD